MEKHARGSDIAIMANKIKISYNDVGRGSIPVLFIHGFPFNKSMWKSQVDFLKSSHRVIAYDIRGFGKSTNDATEVSIQLFADDLIKFMDVLQISKAVLCGLSMGGYIALNVVNRFPERVAGLVLCDTQCIEDSADGREKRYQTIRQVEAEGMNDFTQSFLKNIFHEDSLTNKKDIVKKIEDIILANPANVITGGLVALAERSETCSSLGSISAPTLILCGREDIITPLAQSEFMHKNIKKSSLQIIECAGHVSNLEQPDVFNKQLQIFLSTFSQ